MTRRFPALLLAATLIACTAESDAGREVVVFAATSLTEALDDLSAAFERRHPGSEVVVNLAGSNQLALQIEQGAPAHVYISANPHWMDYLVQRRMAVRPVAIASNQVVIATPPDNPGNVLSWTHLTREGLLVVTAAPQVPAGRYADSVLARLGHRPDAPSGYVMGVRQNVVSHEESVKGVVAKLLLGEADVGFVYRTDVTDASGLRIVSLPDGVGLTDNYLMAIIDSDVALARAFAAFILSEDGTRILHEWGFDAPLNMGS